LQPTRWTTVYPDAPPTVPYDVTENDAKFLHGIKVDPELCKTEQS